MSDIFREVDEAIQQDKMLKIWNEHKTTIVAAVAVLIMSSALTTTYHSWNSGRNAAETARLIQAIDSTNAAQDLPTIIEDTRKNHAAIGTFIAAGLALENDKKDEAAAFYLEAAESRKTPRDLRDLARVLYVQNAHDPSIDVLKPLLANEKSPWIWHARIEAAVLSAAQNDYKNAIPYLKGFEKVTTIPLSLKQRGLALHHVYTLKNKSENKTES
jgi:hypothetical protein